MLLRREHRAELKQHEAASKGIENRAALPEPRVWSAREPGRAKGMYSFASSGPGDVLSGKQIGEFHPGAGRIVHLTGAGCLKSSPESRHAPERTVLDVHPGEIDIETETWIHTPPDRRHRGDQQ